MPGDPAETVYEGKFIRVVKSGHYEYVARKDISGVVAILPLTADGKIILVEQFRVPLGRRVVSIPAGLAGDKKGESKGLLESAQRELREETGYASSDWKLLAAGPSSSGLTDEIITIFLAHDAVRDEKAELDADEKIEIHEVPLTNLPTFLHSREKAGRAIDYKIFAALYLAGRPLGQ